MDEDGLDDFRERLARREAARLKRLLEGSQLVKTVAVPSQEPPFYVFATFAAWRTLALAGAAHRMVTRRLSEMASRLSSVQVHVQQRREAVREGCERALQTWLGTVWHVWLLRTTFAAWSWICAEADLQSHLQEVALQASHVANAARDSLMMSSKRVPKDRLRSRTEVVDIQQSAAKALEEVNAELALKLASAEQLVTSLRHQMEQALLDQRLSLEQVLKDTEGRLRGTALRAADYTLSRQSSVISALRLSSCFSTWLLAAQRSKRDVEDLYRAEAALYRRAAARADSAAQSLSKRILSLAAEAPLRLAFEAWGLAARKAGRRRLDAEDHFRTAETSWVQEKETTAVLSRHRLERLNVATFLTTQLWQACDQGALGRCLAAWAQKSKVHKAARRLAAIQGKREAVATQLADRAIVEWEQQRCKRAFLAWSGWCSAAAARRRFQLAHAGDIEELRQKRRERGEQTLETMARRFREEMEVKLLKQVSHAWGAEASSVAAERQKAEENARRAAAIEEQVRILCKARNAARLTSCFSPWAREAKLRQRGLATPSSPPGFASAELQSFGQPVSSKETVCAPPRSAAAALRLSSSTQGAVLQADELILDESFKVTRTLEPGWPEATLKLVQRGRTDQIHRGDPSQQQVANAAQRRLDKIKRSAVVALCSSLQRRLRVRIFLCWLLCTVRSAIRRSWANPPERGLGPVGALQVAVDGGPFRRVPIHFPS